MSPQNVQNQMQLNFSSPSSEASAATVKPRPNSAQMLAIQTLEGPVMVLAGPGTGKTFTLINRIENMLNSGIKPENILCLAFSETAAAEMKKRVSENFKTSANAVTISTYHSFCMDIIKRFPSRFELLDTVSVVDDITKTALIKEALDEFEPEFLKDKWGNKYFYVSKIKAAIDVIKRERVSEGSYFEKLESWKKVLCELEKTAQEKEKIGKLTKTALQNIEKQKTKIGKAIETYEVFKSYEKKLRTHGLLDFSDMINLVIETLSEDEELLNEITADYKYIMVDEYQDTNASQNEILFLVARGAQTQNIFVVGDDDQIIYSFQGARCDNLETFLIKYPQARVICLEENRRSTQTILDFAQNIIKDDPSRLSNNPAFARFGIKKELIAKNPALIEKEAASKDGEVQYNKIFFNIYDEKTQENNEIVKKIEELISNPSQKLKEIAVLMTKNDQLRELSLLLEARNIPFQLKMGKSIFEINSSLLAYFYLKAIDNHKLNSDKLFALLTSPPFEFDDDDYLSLLKFTRTERKDFITCIKENPSHVWKNPQKVRDFYETFCSLLLKKNSTNLYNFLLEIFTKTGLISHFADFENFSPEYTYALKRLADEALSFKKLHKATVFNDFIRHLDAYLNENIPLNIPDDSQIKNAIQLLTYHGSKGREFEHVFMPALSSSNWEKARSGGELDLPINKSVFFEDKVLNTKAENLKKLFVGATRAKCGLYLSYYQLSTSAQSLTSYLEGALEDENLVKTRIFPLDEVSAPLECAVSLFSDSKTRSFKDEIKLRLQKPVISQKSLNLFFGCPRSYLYSEVYKIPVYQEDTTILSYGNSIHRALEWAMRNLKETGATPSLTQIKEIFNENLVLCEFKDEETFNLFLSRGKEALEHYYPEISATSAENVFDIEHKFDFDFDTYEIKGFVDLIKKESGENFSLASENASGYVFLYDYKTGTKKSIPGDPEKRANDRYYTQLSFYKWAFEKKYPHLKVRDAGLIYVEDPQSLVLAELCEQDNIKIGEKVREMLEKLKNLDFKPQPSVQTCKNCNYKLICRLKTL